MNSGICILYKLLTNARETLHRIVAPFRQLRHFGRGVRRRYVAFAALSWACFQHASALNHHQNKNHSEDPECPSDPGIQNSHAGQLLLLSAVLPSFTIQPVGIL